MISFFIGLLLTSLKMLPSFCFRDIRYGSLLILSILFFVDTLTAIVTQSLGIFTYPIIISIHTAYAVVSILIFFFYGKKDLKDCFRVIFVKKTLFVLLCLAISLGYFFKTHYRHTGEVKTIDGVSYVENDYYPYPLYSDEWVGAAFVKKVFETKKLPLINPFTEGKSDANFLVFFYSFTAHQMMLLGLDPVLNYSALSILVAFGVMLINFFFLRSSGVSFWTACSSIFLVPLVLNTTHTPGLLFYLPYTLSFFFVLCAFLAGRIESRESFILFLVLSFIFYPAILILILPLAFLYFRGDVKGLVKFAVGLAAGIILIFLVLWASGLELELIFLKIKSLLIKEKVTDFHQFLYPWTMITIPVFILSLLGLYVAFLRKSYLLLFSISLGYCLWIIQHFTRNYFFLEHVRAISITSYLLILCSAFGLEAFYDSIKCKGRYIVIVCLFVLFGSFAIYNSFDLSRLKDIHIRLKGQQLQVKNPAIHVNRYIHPDDLELFKGISGKRFLSHPWKSLVISTITGNIPLNTKHSTVTIYDYSYYKFLSLPCHKKKTVADEYMIDYVYSEAIINCKGFTHLGTGKEGLSLYFVE